MKNKSCCVALGANSVVASTSANSLDLSLVIVNWNTCSLLRDCLTSLPQGCADLTWEVLVVDNDSHDDSVAMIVGDFPEVKLISAGANIGFSRGNNLAFPETIGKYVLLLNPDTVCPPKSLSKLVAFAGLKNALGAVGPDRKSVV